MEIIRQIFPYLLVLFFIIKANKSPLYLLGIPFLMFMSNSIFFENARLFNIPGRYQLQLGFFWLIPLWIFAKIISKKKLKNLVNKSNLNIIDYFIYCLIIITFIGLAATVTEYYPILKNVLLEFLTIISILLVYFILKDWFSNNEPQVILNFLYSLVVVNSIASFLYILHQGFHFNIYVAIEYMTESFQGKEITRTFWFMPQFLFFSIVFLLVFARKYSFITITLLTVNILAIVITYTISSVAIAIIIFLIYLILKGLKQGRLGNVFKNIFIYALIGISGVFILSKLLPANVNYLLSRITEHTDSQYTTKEPNDMEFRLTNSLDVISKMDYDKKILGMGPVTEFQSSKILEMKQNTADTVWSGVILHWGFVGLAIFILIYFVSGLKAFNYFMKNQGVISDFALMILLYIISQFIEGFVSWTFLSGHGVTIGLWYFALLSYIPILKNYEKALVRKNERFKEYKFA